MSSLVIRDYTPADKLDVLEVMSKNIPEYFAPSERKDLENYLEREIERYFVCELAKNIVGAGGINFRPDEHRAVISWDFIDPALQGKGLGSELSRYRLDVLRRREDVRKVIVRTTQMAWKFYERHGFELQFIETDYWERGFDLYFMELKGWR